MEVVHLLLDKANIPDRAKSETRALAAADKTTQAGVSAWDDALIQEGEAVAPALAERVAVPANQLRLSERVVATTGAAEYRDRELLPP